LINSIDFYDYFIQRNRKRKVQKRRNIKNIENLKKVGALVADTK